MVKIEEFYDLPGTLFEIWEDDGFYAIYIDSDIVKCGMTENEAYNEKRRIQETSKKPSS